mmetsp:Transcript_56692/g.159091  ORF Transcript_56692/g.159091 Transcript_56692/m.159091 type:complete len:260 (-) Transcript_56692:392-1171(-)
MIQTFEESILAFLEGNSWSCYKRCFLEEHLVVFQWHRIHEGWILCCFDKISFVVEMVCPVIKQSHRLLVVWSHHGQVGRIGFIDFYGGSISNLESWMSIEIARVLQCELGFMASRVHHDFGAHCDRGAFALWLKLDGSSILIMHKTTSRFVHVDSNCLGDMFCSHYSKGFAQRFLQRESIHSKIWSVQSESLFRRNIERSTKIAISDWPFSVDRTTFISTLKLNTELAVSIHHTFPFVFPYPIVRNPIRVKVLICHHHV